MSAGELGKQEIDRWGAVWGVAELSAHVRVEFSSRLRRSLGRAEPRRGVVRLAAALESAAPALLAEVLCHELAHVAVHLVHRRRVRPHGPEWAALMRTAGFEPRVRFDARDLPPELALRHAAARRRAARVFLHTCPVCAANRLARRPVHGWRCAVCLGAGRDGRLLVTRVDESVPRGIR